MDAYIRILAPMGKLDMEKKGRMEDREKEVKGLEKRKINVGRQATNEAKGRGRKERKEKRGMSEVGTGGRGK